jgi:hypothetical protein
VSTPVPANQSSTPPGFEYADPLGILGFAHRRNTNTNAQNANRTPDQSNLARSFSSMEEFFRDFDRRHGSSAFVAPTAGAGGLGAESYVPWRHPMGDFIVSFSSKHIYNIAKSLI